jgi:hypothetical protein
VSWFQIGAAKAACATTTWAKSAGSALRMPIIGYASGRCTEIARLARIPALCSTAVFATRGAGSQGPRLRFW